MPLNYRLLRDRVEMGFFRVSLGVADRRGCKEADVLASKCGAYPPSGQHAEAREVKVDFVPSTGVVDIKSDAMSNDRFGGKQT